MSYPSLGEIAAPPPVLAQSTAVPPRELQARGGAAALRPRKRGDSENPDTHGDINGLGPRLAARHRQGTCSL